MRKPSPRAAVITTLLLCAACATAPKPGAESDAPKPTIEVEPAPEWMSVASSEDQDRIARTQEAWRAALAEARGRFAGAIKAEGPLLDPGAALAAPAPSPGSYRCRVIKIGTQSGRGPAFNPHKSFFCYVEAEGTRLNITKQTGSQRPAGWLYGDSDTERLIFLGTLALGDEKEPLAYGEDKARDMAGVVERVAPFRYRLVVPWPRTESKLDVIELVPVVQ